VKRRPAKRLLDLLLAAFALLLLWPLLLAAALAIKLDSPGPVLFRQQRVGRHGRIFRIHKLRTMVVEAPAQGLPLTVGADPRITRVGAWLRARRIDELPQLVDVLTGDMSLVGPRPEVPRWVAHYPAQLRERVLAVKPGITCASTLAFADEAQRLASASDAEREYVEVILPAKLALAADYAERATLTSDLCVLVKTAALLLRR
jgi:lipopolysaccharide/colanic/teichoic acid biosynthesis glycosyltransferase